LSYVRATSEQMKSLWKSLTCWPVVNLNRPVSKVCCGWEWA